MKTAQRGSAIAAALVIIILVVGMGAALATVSISLTQSSSMHNVVLVASYEAEAGIERVLADVAASGYDDRGNLWLIDNSVPAWDSYETRPWASDVPVFGPQKVGRAMVEVYIYDLDDPSRDNDDFMFYRVISSATLDGRTVMLAQDVRARDTFAKYMFFVDADSISFGTSTVRGAVHSNRSIYFYFGGAHFYDPVTAKRGFYYRSGANQQNTNFYDRVDSGAPHIKMPSVNEINFLRPNAEGVYDVHNDNNIYGGQGSLDAEIEFLGDQVYIRAIRATTGETIREGTYPLPASKIIFVQGDVVSVKGEINGRCTVAAIGDIDVTGPITYVDSEGDPRYQLLKNGTPMDPETTNEPWTEANGFTYEENPNYSGDSVCGLMTAKGVTVTRDAPYNMELHAAIYAATQNWHCDLSERKGNLKVVGSIVNKRGGWRYNSAGYGWAQSGEYIYDALLLQNPPPYWLPVDSPIYGPRWKQSQR
ncbi:MAG: hypothetical protein ACYTAF_13985 [Planctomycetota bacterium]